MREKERICIIEDSDYQTFLAMYDFMIIFVNLFFILYYK